MLTLTYGTLRYVTWGWKTRINQSGNDLDLWPLTLKTFSAIPNNMMNIYAKFHWNPSTYYRDIHAKYVLTNGRTTDGRHTRISIASAADSSIAKAKINCKCMPILLYGLECFSVAKHDLSSLDFTVTRLLMKLFRLSNVNVIDECRLFLISCYLVKRLKKDESILKIRF